MGDVARLIPVGAIGVVAVALAFATGLPGDGGFVVVAWLAGLATVLLRPGWAGFQVLAGSITVTAVIADMSDGVFGLVAPIVAALVAVLLVVFLALAAADLARNPP